MVIWTIPWLKCTTLIDILVCSPTGIFGEHENGTPFIKCICEILNGIFL
jgi:hypothetical protein